jgi:NADPH:quinone reductase-like Zn-dependent oxidoreductase
MQTETLVFVEADKVALQSIEMPAPRPGEVQIRTQYSTISGGTEGWALQNLFTWAATRFPCVPGYQRVGIIESVGAEVTGWRVGDRVMATVGAWEGPIHPFWGAHAALANTSAYELYPIPEGVQAIINNHTANVVEVVHAHTGDQPVTAVLDSVQSEAAQREYMPQLERGRGQIVYCGFTPGKTWADMGALQQRELTTHLISGWTRPRMESTLALMAAGKMSLKPLITHLSSYKNGPEMYRMNASKSQHFLGITLDWTT